MQHRITLPQLKKYDVSQRVIEALADSESRAIIFTIIRRGKTAYEIADSLKIPLSTVYKKLLDLEYLTLVKIEKRVMTNKGRKFKVYRSRIKSAEIIIKKSEPVISLVGNLK